MYEKHITNLFSSEEIGFTPFDFPLKKEKKKNEK